MNNIDKIRQEIERRKKEHMYNEMPITIGRYYEDRDLLAFIDLLLQEKPTCKTCGFYENNCPFIRGKLIPYPSKVCKDYIHSVMKEQEQPDEDLEKAVEEYRRETCNEACKNSFLDNHPSPSIKTAFIAGSEWRYQKDRAEFAKLKAKEWNDGYDDAMSQFVKIPYISERWFETTDGEFIAGAIFEEPIPADSELYYKKEDKQ